MDASYACLTCQIQIQRFPVLLCEGAEVFKFSVNLSCGSSPPFRRISDFFEICMQVVVGSVIYLSTPWSSAACGVGLAY